MGPRLDSMPRGLMQDRETRIPLSSGNRKPAPASKKNLPGNGGSREMTLAPTQPAKWRRSSASGGCSSA